MLKKKISKIISLIIVLCLIVPTLVIAAPGDPQKIQYIYFQDASSQMVIVDYAKAINDVINGDMVLYNSIKEKIGIAMLTGAPVYFETTIGNVLDYQKAFTDNKPDLIQIQDDPLYQSVKPEYTMELIVVGGVATIIPIVIPVAPAVTNDDTANIVSGMVAGLEYKLDAAEYVVYDQTVFQNLDFSGNHTLLVRVAAAGTTPAGEATTLTFTTNPVTDTIINIAAIPGVVAPVRGETPVTTITETAQYTGTVAWTPADATFGASTVYTATITLTAKAGFTLTGVTADYFTVVGTTATNPADSGVVTAGFPITEAATIPVTGVTLDQATLNLTAGGATGTLLETVNPANATNKTVTWSSSNEAVATVVNGVVTPLAAGTATITVTTVDGGFTATSAVTVQAATIPVTGVTLDQATLNLTAGGATGTLLETVNPANATNKTVTWSSSNEAVATVVNGVVTPLAAGTATITVTTVDGGFTATSAVTVQAATIPVTGVTLDQATLSLTAGGATGTLLETVNPANATNKAVTWSSSNELVATVANGVVTPLAAGTATITVTTVDGNFTATSAVTVQAAVITGTLSLVGETLGVKSYQIVITGAAPEDVTQVLVNGVSKTFQIIDGVVRFNSTTIVASVQMVVLGQTINVPTGMITATATLVSVVLGIETYNVQVIGATPEDVTAVLVNNVSNPFEVIAGLVRVNSGTTVTSIKIVALGQTIEVSLP
ncbi:MAG: Ig-like domain-containing protein [Gudongella sp.]|nr:Ig-like domain-containing protein [Gudongella sp.]